MNLKTRLEAGCLYHVFNRGNNRENLFKESPNYAFFLERYVRHAGPFVDTVCYCLMPNHFHLLIRVKQEEAWPTGRSPARAFGNFFASYAKSMNNRYSRTGSLFENRFKRLPVDEARYAARLVCYIHSNSQKHGFTTDFRTWPHSSYKALQAEELPAFVRRDLAYGLFGGRDGFLRAHEDAVDDLSDAGLVDPNFETATSVR